MLIFFRLPVVFFSPLLHILFIGKAVKNSLNYVTAGDGMEEHMSVLNNDEIPVGLSMALAENLRAMERFSNMNEQERQEFISRSRSVGSKQEMRSLVSGLDSMN